jgi:HK97 family phage major capsid protein
MSALKEKDTKDLRGRLAEVNKQAAEILSQAGPNYDFAKVTAVDGDTTAKLEQFRALNDEATDIGKELDTRAEFEAIDRRLQADNEPQRHPGHSVPSGDTGRRQEQETKSLGGMFVDSVAYTGWTPGAAGPVAELPDVNMLATLFQTSAGWAAPSIRGPKVVDYATRQLRVADLFPQGQTTQASILYMEETTFTNNAAETAEGAAKPEAVLALTERTEPVRKIAVTLPVTDEQLSDVVQVKSYIDNRLGYMVLQRLDGQLLVGDGSAPNLRGILNRSGIQTQAKGADPVPDAIYKAMTLIRVNAFSEPDAAVFHPSDWQDVRLLRTADGIYIWGSPADAGPERIWGLNVVQTVALTQNTALVGAFRESSELVIREGVSLSVGYVNDDFQKNRQTVRAEMRAALAVYRAASFAQVTGV